ncbi:hypothetical protein H1C71_006041 [Ictidomys tridecemlineatus]|nr:hypothetical protein H1C71_006041 [Ictidomys tridecemlineatus]
MEWKMCDLETQFGSFRVDRGYGRLRLPRARNCPVGAEFFQGAHNDGSIRGPNCRVDLGAATETPPCCWGDLISTANKQASSSSISPAPSFLPTPTYLLQSISLKSGCRISALAPEKDK